MSQPINRTVSLSPARRLVSDVMHFGQKVASMMLERRAQLAPVALARAALPNKPSWYAIFAKAYGIVSARHPELRRSYMTLPWARLFEHAQNVAMVPIERQMGDEDIVVYVPLPEPEKRTIQELDDCLYQHKDKPLESIKFFRTQLWTSRLPQPLRRLLWWLGLNMWGRVRAYFYGTFGLTGLGAYDTTCVTILSPLTITLTYGVIEPDGSVILRLNFDHRVMDGALPARSLIELEEVLNGEILQELQQMKTLPLAA
jgi:hypothetical protein